MNGHNQRALVSVVLAGPWPTAVTPGTGAVVPSYDVDAAFMLLQVHGWDIHAV